ncbi:hypothetical protein GCM10008013_38910 [Paenibacillus segetis]|uniref:Uncharacterized protein n=1 Tax=Paenibacillus segetis TaxID=1325360 RepID=A0ABQ1YPF0_9BACL|nr:hypothetical protein GCM10008013_38910 [Paenibacillus segetis]
MLQFLLHCQGQDPKHYEEWQALLEWLMSAFPKSLHTDEQELAEEEEGEEQLARRHVEAKIAEDKNYPKKLLQAVMERPMSEKSFLALEQLAFVDLSEIDDALHIWLNRSDLHPLLQYRVLQILNRRGSQGLIKFQRGGEEVEIELDQVPLKPTDFPSQIQDVLERIEQHTGIHNPTLFYFAQELWYQFIMGVYGTMNYRSMLSEEDSILDVWAAALHTIVAETLQDDQSDEEIRNLYGITDSLRLRYEQAYRSMKQFISIGIKS